MKVVLTFLAPGQTKMRVDRQEFVWKLFWLSLFLVKRKWKLRVDEQEFASQNSFDSSCSRSDDDSCFEFQPSLLFLAKREWQPMRAAIDKNLYSTFLALYIGQNEDLASSHVHSLVQLTPVDSYQNLEPIEVSWRISYRWSGDCRACVPWVYIWWWFIL